MEFETETKTKNFRKNIKVNEFVRSSTPTAIHENFRLLHGEAGLFFYSKNLCSFSRERERERERGLEEERSEESNDIFGAQSLHRSGVLRRFRGPIRSRYHRSDDYANINDFWEQADGFGGKYANKKK